MNSRIVKAEERVKKAHKNLKKVILEVQSKCKHPAAYVHEGRYQPQTDFLRCQPPFRVCTKCGLAETGWGVGYHTLPDTKTEMSRKEAMKYVRSTICEEEKCAKLRQKRKEVEEAQS